VTSIRRIPNKAIDDYPVGYGRPPKETRFQPGKSGNPRGRPKVERELSVTLREALNRPVEVINKKGDRRKVSALDAIVDGIVADAARRDRGAIRQLIDLVKYLDGGKPPNDSKARAAELAAAKESLRVKLEAMAANVRKMPGFVEYPQGIFYVPGSAVPPP
jgi:hypothetical protein